ncbi:hypothetical protein BRADI_4g28975v3 [Brachypodium distachyon]|uniref:Uncharacterized protein n=1 Tax=Brachypodium distachyon TaxID=15368 RepID=A0A2K2CR33_BRADI|nr:hypothetical protein BRADI_4g28975v3 [Brachypodium distachyon]
MREFLHVEPLRFRGARVAGACIGTWKWDMIRRQSCSPPQHRDMGVCDHLRFESFCFYTARTVLPVNRVLFFLA